MKIQYELVLADVVAFQKHLLRRSKKHAQLKQITQIIVPVALALFVVYKLVQQSPLSQMQILLFGGLALLWFVLHHLFFEKIMFAKVEKTVSTQKESLGLGKNSVEITKEGIDFWQKSENLVLPWKRFVRLDETATHIFLVVGEFAGITINKSTADTHDFEKFVKEFRSKLV